MLTLGSVLQNRYEIEQSLGNGGFGTVYRARDRRINKLVAVKETLHTHPGVLQMFERETVVLASLDHPTLPGVSDYFEESGRYYLVMAYVAGEDLAEYIKRHSPPHLGEYETWEITVPVLEGLEYMHSRTPPVIHRDIKPNNIRITPDRRVYLVDFGMAKVYDARNPNPASSLLAHSPGYSPPEHYCQLTDTRSDLYALGATLYSMLTGYIPPPALARQTGSVFQPLRTINPAVSPRTEDIVMRLLAMNPADRYQQVSDLRRDVQALLNEMKAPLDLHSSSPDMTETSLLGAVQTSPTTISVSMSQQNQPSSSTDSSMTMLVSDMATRVLSYRRLYSFLPLLLSSASVLLVVLIIFFFFRAENWFGSTPIPTTPPSRSGPQGTLVETSIPDQFATLTRSPTHVLPKTSTPVLIPVVDDIDPAELFVETLPLTMTIRGGNLNVVKNARLIHAGRAEILLEIANLDADRLTLCLTSLPELLNGSAPYTLQLNGKNYETQQVTLRDTEIKTVQGVRTEYTYTGRILDSDPPQTIMRDQPDVTSTRTDRLRNGDVVELTRTDIPGWYQVRIRESIDPVLIGRIWWIERWLVDNVDVPLPPVVEQPTVVVIPPSPPELEPEPEPPPPPELEPEPEPPPPPPPPPEPTLPMPVLPGG